GGTDVLAEGLKLSGPTSDTLEVVLRSGAAQINGTVTDAKNQAVAAIEAVLVPAERNRFDLYKTAVTDQNGRFSITGIRPGEYLLFSWDGVDPFRYFDEDFLKRFNAEGKPAHVSE